MQHSLARIALVVRDYDEAIAFYTGVLGFELIEDTFTPEQNKRWVVVAPKGARETQILLARAVGDEQSSRVGNQTGGRVFLFLHTDDFWRDYRASGRTASSSCANRRKNATERWPCSAICTVTSGICIEPRSTTHEPDRP